MPATPARRRPARRLPWTPVLLALLVCGLLYGLWWGWTNAIMTPRPKGLPAGCAATAATPFDTTRVTVNVYNAGARSGMAGQVAENLRQAGFVVRSVANTDDRATATVVRGATADAPGVVLVAGFFTGAQVQADGRADETVDVLVGSEFQPIVPSAPRSTLVPGPGCRSTSATPAASATPGSTAAPSAPVSVSATPAATPSR